MPQLPRTLSAPPQEMRKTRNAAIVPLEAGADGKKRRLVPTKKQQRLDKQLRELVRLRYIERLRVDECAEELGVSQRTIYLWMGKPEFAALVETMRQEWTEQARVEVKSLQQEALSTLKDLMSLKTRSEHVRFEAAAKLLDLGGVAMEAAQEGGDDLGEVARLTELLQQQLARPTNVNVFSGMLQPGGYLPSAGISEAGRQLQAYANDEPVTVVDADADHPAFLESTIEGSFSER